MYPVFWLVALLVQCEGAVRRGNGHMSSTQGKCFCISTTDCHLSIHGCRCDEIHCACLNGWEGDYCGNPGTLPPHITTTHASPSGTSTCNCLSSECSCLNGGHCANHYSIISCACPDSWTGSRCEIPVATTPPTTAMPSTPPTTQAVTGYYICNQSSVDNAIANHRTSFVDQAVACQSGLHNSDEAFLMDHCSGIPADVTQWKKGVPVGRFCKDIMEYTPIAAFYNQVYSESQSISGIFIGCTGDHSFQMAVQECGYPPRVIELTPAGINLFDSNVYFTLYRV